MRIYSSALFGAVQAMTDAIYRGCFEVRDERVSVTYVNMSAVEESLSESDLIPDWAAVSIAIGILIAAVGLVSAFLTDRSWPVIGLTIGLIIAAICMRGAESGSAPT